MSNISRRSFITSGLAVAAGASGIAAAAKVAQHHGLIPPEAGGLPAARCVTAVTCSREFTHSDTVRVSPILGDINFGLGVQAKAYNS
jgi:hypothetical protein